MTSRKKSEGFINIFRRRGWLIYQCQWDCFKFSSCDLKNKVSSAVGPGIFKNIIVIISYQISPTNIKKCKAVCIIIRNRIVCILSVYKSGLSVSNKRQNGRTDQVSILVKLSWPERKVRCWAGQNLKICPCKILICQWCWQCVF